jgi:AhpD family alkylhydroperoxidase
MTTRPNPYMIRGDLVQPLVVYGNTVEAAGLERSLIELVKIRASQINGCGMCLHMHTRDALKAGESELKIALLGAWRDSPLFTERERAALGWTEVLTVIASEAERDRAHEAVADHFSAEDQVTLVHLIGAINAFNRVNVAFKVRHAGSAPKATEIAEAA